MKNLLVLLLFTFFASTLNYAQDTIKVQTFKWSDGHRSDTFDFPDDPLVTYRKILMRYNMRCHDAAVGNGSVGCREWDYSCNTFVTDPTRVDSTAATAPDYTISNFSGTSFPFRTTPSYVYTSYDQHESNLVAGSNPSEIVFTGQGTEKPHNPATAAYRYQVILPADELISSGLTVGSISGLKTTLLQGGGTLGFYKIKLKNTTADIAGSKPDEDGLQEVYFKSTDMSNNGEITLPFYQTFNWTGGNLLVDISFTTNDREDVPTFSFTATASSEAALQSSFTTNENNLYFGGVSTLDLQKASVENIRDEITISFWCFGNPANLPANTSIVEGFDAAGNRQANVHLPWSNSRVYWDCGNDGTGYDRIEKDALVENLEGHWNHWAFTKKATTGEMKIFLNGVLWHSGNGLTKQMDFDAFRFGKSLNNNNPYYGSIDEVQVWNKALDEATISSWMNVQIHDSHPDYANLVAYFNLNEGFGNTAGDTSSLMLDASIVLPSWRSVRGDHLFHNFSKTNLWPRVTFLQGDYSIIDSPVTVLDSVESDLHEVIHFGVEGTDLVRLDTQLVYPAGDRPIYNEAGELIGTKQANAEGTIDIQTLNYFSKRDAKFEILSLVTPYGNGLDLGPDGKTFVFDVTDFGPVLQGRRKLSLEYGGQNQEEMDIQFWFITGIPERDVLNIQPIWPQNRGYMGDILSNKVFEPRQVSLMPSASYYKIRAAITGHGQNGEFISRQHFINVKGGAQEFPFVVWKGCSTNPIYPQGGTWIFDRAGWCPGMETDVRSFSLDGYVTPGETIEIDYGVNGGDMSEANYLVNNLLVSYGTFNYQTDASIEDVMRPNLGRVEYARINPACNTPTILVKNTGEDLVESLKFTYRTSPDKEETFTWFGFMEQQEIVEIELPLPDANFWTGSSDFSVTLTEVNGAPDGNSDNNEYHTTYSPAPIYNYVDPVQLRVQTNIPGSDYFYTILDGEGNVVFLRNNMSSNTVYQDDLNFPPGCYTLDFRDSGEDGLSFWFFPENGTGSLRFQRKLQSGGTIPLHSFNPDFGGGVQYDFVLGDITSANEEIDQAFQVFSTYPNPAYDELNIDLFGFENRDLRFKLVDMTGQIVLTKVFKSEFGKETTQIDMSTLTPGMYILHCTDGKRNWVRDIVKIN